MSKQSLLPFLESHLAKTPLAPQRKQLISLFSALAQTVIAIQQTLMSKHVTIHGHTGTYNEHGDLVQKLDVLTNNLFLTHLTKSGQVHTILSEELTQPYHPKKSQQGQYLVCLDPLDGSSNIDCNATIGSIFSIYPSYQTPLLEGKKQLASGYALYGPLTLFVCTFGFGVFIFCLDPKTKKFSLTHSEVRIPQKGSIYSINEANEQLFPPQIRRFLQDIKQQTTPPPYKARYIGSMVADVHRTLVKGGIFLHPHLTNKKEPTIRLLYEANPLAFIIEQAGGKALSESTSPLSIVPKQAGQKVPIVLGSPRLVEQYYSYK